MASIMEIMQLCRLCLVKEQVNIPIFEDQGDIRQIFLKITACLPVKVSKEDQLPKKICDGCLYKLELLYQFWNTTANAEKQLLSWIEQSNMDLNSKPSEESSINTHPQVKQEKIEPTESTNENADLSADAQNYILQQQQLAYQANFPYKESQGSNVEGDDAVEDPEEPEPKRRRRGQRRQATKPIPPESLDSSDNEAADTLMEMTVTKTEEESESDGDENVDDPESSKFVTVAEDREQPGPSGLGKGTTEAPSKIRKYKAHRRLGNCQVIQQNDREKGHSWLCKKCNKQFPTSRSLKRHSKEDHLPDYSKPIYKYIYDPDSKTYSCKMCKLESKIKKEIEEHALTHEDKFTCEICQEVLFSAYKYALHMYTHKDDGVYICPLCQCSTSRRSTIFQHINTVHLQKYSYQCKHCGKGFRDGITYREHENLHINSNTMKCVVCDKEFSYTRNLVLHQTRHHRVTTIDPQSENQCTICKKSFTRANNLKKHMNIHNDTIAGSRPHVCEWCGKSFTDKTTLNHHNRIHTGYKPYKCNYCEKAFSKKGYLILHERTHTGEKPHCCEYCGKGFNQLTSLKVHVRTHTGEKPYTCHICDSNYISKIALKSHIISCSG